MFTFLKKISENSNTLIQSVVKLLNKYKIYFKPKVYLKNRVLGSVLSLIRNGLESRIPDNVKVYNVFAHSL